MIEKLLPAMVVAREAFDDSVPVTLFPQEEAALGNPVDKRRREFGTARRCAHEALAELGFPGVPVPSGPRREPRWPVGVVGSITHCAGYRAAVVAHAADLVTLGIDAEPHEPLPTGVLGSITVPDELTWLAAHGAAHPQVHWDRLLFCAKEAVYKAWYPLAERWLGFEEAYVEADLPDSAGPTAAAGASDPATDTGAGAAIGGFTARLLVDGPQLPDGTRLTSFTGRWLTRNGLIVVAIAVEPA
ncbi:4'-phosphopantetheinyl transferase family protein [Micromonospora sp. NBC_01813]|uniref:4'-phosphopantetheinyl transferase family protein n=1 Tax=Micromonospora sp. NBC_01813 TaxID=2975988 RepID=UPI002DDBF799|nr:4'-phosphopantetheinyl transferase superfamily protein [Micromonospora sp. NBC_01813]WSA11383.1 4'-phosphopantetheinyl transferase superfamily protein [Micromonospora sp. NBC_01813]